MKHLYKNIDDEGLEYNNGGGNPKIDFKPEGTE